MDSVRARRTWLFVLRDNSSYEVLHLSLDKEDITAVKAVEAFLGLEHVRAQWHHGHVSVLWCVDHLCHGFLLPDGVFPILTCIHSYHQPAECRGRGWERPLVEHD